MTRKAPDVTKTNSILFEGPPGTGKTTVAKILATAINVPTIYLSQENILSKFYSEGE